MMQGEKTTSKPPQKARRACDWCGRDLAPLGLRVEAECCSAKCRKARHRFGASCVPQHRAAHPLRLAYFDPPYPGQSALYRGHADYAGEVDLRQLVCDAVAFDGWALSTSAKALPSVLRVCEEAGAAVRVAGWFRGARGGAGAKRPRAAWEPVIYSGGRALEGAPPDALVAGVAPRTSDPKRVIGAKPAAFAFWLFELLGALPGDHFHDRFPGSGGILRAWSIFERRALQSQEPSHLEPGRLQPRRVLLSSSTRARPVRLEDASAGDAGRLPGRRVAPAHGTHEASLRTSRRIQAGAR